MSVKEFFFDLSDTAAVYCDATVRVKTVALRSSSAAHLVVPRPDGERSAFPLTGFKETMEVQFFFSVYKRMEMWEDWLENSYVNLMSEWSSLNQQLVDGRGYFPAIQI